jgi:hypothetical protein
LHGLGVVGYEDGLEGFDDDDAFFALRVKLYISLVHLVLLQNHRIRIAQELSSPNVEVGFDKAGRDWFGMC